MVRRWQFEFSDDEDEQLKELMQKCGIKTKSELLNNALSLFKWAVDVKEEGRIIVAMDGKNKKYRELLMPCMRLLKGGTEQERS